MTPPHTKFLFLDDDAQWRGIETRGYWRFRTPTPTTKWNTNALQSTVAPGSVSPVQSGSYLQLVTQFTLAQPRRRAQEYIIFLTHPPPIPALYFNLLN